MIPLYFGLDESTPRYQRWAPRIAAAGFLTIIAVVVLFAWAITSIPNYRTQFDTPTHYCGSVHNVDTGERINGTPVYERRCRVYFRRPASPSNKGQTE